MKYGLVSLTCVVLMSGCVTLEAPEDLISDSVKAGTDLYYTVKDKLSGEDRKVFEVAYQAADSESVSQATEQCLETALNNARKALVIDTPEVNRTSSEVVRESGTVTVHCKVFI